jgi:hypothetical protein
MEGVICMEIKASTRPSKGGEPLAWKEQFAWKSKPPPAPKQKIPFA